MKTRRILLFFASLIALVPQTMDTASAQDVAAAARANRARKEAAKNNDAGDSEWYRPTHASLRVQGRDASLIMLYEFSPDGDLKLTVDAQERGKRESGEVMVIKGRSQWMLAKNIPLEEGYEIDVLDGPVLNLKLAIELLRAAVPGGPTAVKEKTTIDVKENSQSIAVNTASASGGLDAPWTLRGTIEPVAADEWSFALTVNAGGEASQMNGTWKKAAMPPVFADDMPLDGWQILSIGPIRRTEGSSTIYDFGAQPSSQGAKTLGELRKM